MSNSTLKNLFKLNGILYREKNENEFLVSGNKFYKLLRSLGTILTPSRTASYFIKGKSLYRIRPAQQYTADDSLTYTIVDLCEVVDLVLSCVASLDVEATYLSAQHFNLMCSKNSSLSVRSLSKLLQDTQRFDQIVYDSSAAMLKLLEPDVTVNIIDLPDALCVRIT